MTIKRYQDNTYLKINSDIVEQVDTANKIENSIEMSKFKYDPTVESTKYGNESGDFSTEDIDHRGNKYIHVERKGVANFYDIYFCGLGIVMCGKYLVGIAV